MSQPIRGRGDHLVFRILPKNTNLIGDVEILHPVKFRSIPFRREVENVSANQMLGRPFWFFPMCPKNTNLVGYVEILLPPKFPLIPFSCFRGEVENVSANQRPGRPSFFPIGPKNTNLVGGVEILLPLKFRWIPSRYFRGEVENVSTNQRPGRPSRYFQSARKHKLGRGRLWYLASCQVSLNSVQRFQRSQKCFSQSQAGAAILFFRSAPQHKLVKGGWDLASSQVSLNSVQRFQRIQTLVSLRRTTDGRTMRYDNSSLEHSAQVS